MQEQLYYEYPTPIQRHPNLSKLLINVLVKLHAKQKQAN